MKQFKETDGTWRHSRKTYAIVFGSIVGGVFFLTWFIPAVRFVNSYNPTEATSTTEYVDLTPEKIMKVQDKLLDELSVGCETKSVKEPDAAIVFDSNNQASLGRFQFQIKTVQHYVKVFDGKEINRHDAIMIALDPVKSRELARRVIFEVKDGIETNWYNCALSHQFTKEVEVIQEFSKI